mmetsp:Transcript_16509/g.34507  ORF Transcript_16509/g.34507 Transcript_16509/m.34507 type:complete len:224 (-) Transcript_16509:254-925(-)
MTALAGGRAACLRTIRWWPAGLLPPRAARWWPAGSPQPAPLTAPRPTSPPTMTSLASTSLLPCSVTQATSSSTPAAVAACSISTDPARSTQRALSTSPSSTSRLAMLGATGNINQASRSSSRSASPTTPTGSPTPASTSSSSQAAAPALEQKEKHPLDVVFDIIARLHKGEAVPFRQAKHDSKLDIALFEESVMEWQSLGIIDITWMNGVRHVRCISDEIQSW